MGVEALCKGLKAAGSSGLKELDLSHTAADDKAAAALAGLLSSSRALERLVLTHTGISDAGAQLLCSALQVSEPCTVRARGSFVLAAASSTMRGSVSADECVCVCVCRVLSVCLWLHTGQHHAAVHQCQQQRQHGQELAEAAQPPRQGQELMRRCWRMRQGCATAAAFLL